MLFGVQIPGKVDLFIILLCHRMYVFIILSFMIRSYIHILNDHTKCAFFWIWVPGIWKQKFRDPGFCEHSGSTIQAIT